MFRKCCLVAALLFATATVSEAQRPVTFGVKVGTNVAQGDFGDLFKSGTLFGAQLGVNIPMLPIGFRLDADYSKHAAKDFDEVSVHLLTTSLNATYTIPVPSPVIEPYVLAGVSIHKVVSDGFEDVDEEGEEISETKTGFNAGAGVRIPLAFARLFVEGRINSFSIEETKIRSMPLYIGLSF